MAEERKSPTEEIIDQCIEILQVEKKSKRAGAKALKRACDLKEDVEDYKTCCLIKSREIWDLYANLDLCYVVSSRKRTILLNEDIKAHCTKEIALEQKLKDAVKCIKEVKTRLNDVVDEACKIERCIKEEKRCKKGLHELIKEKDNEWLKLLDHIEKTSIHCFNIACKAFDAGVDIVGIQTFVDLDSLKTLGTDLSVKMDTLKTDITANTKKAEEEWKKAFTELTTVKEELVSGEFAKCHSRNAKEGIEKTLDFLCNPHGCDEIKDTEIDEICRKVKENFGNGHGGQDDDYHDRKDDHGKKRPEQRPPRKDDKEQDWELK
jgi:hypothetical protein